MNEECPNCKQITNTSCSRLVKDSCGHTKCRMCLLFEEHGCKICNKDQIQNIENHDFQSSTKENSNKTVTSRTNDRRNKVVLPLELVIHKYSKSETNNFELTSNNCTSNSESYHRDTCDNRKESNVDMPNKPMKCSDRTHISVIPGTPEKYKCNICNKIFLNKKGKCYHDFCITGVRPYKCMFCNKTFIKRSHFEYHERIHRGYKPFKCSLCDKAFPQQNKLNRHMYSHCKEKQFVCRICNKGYTKPDDLKNHLGIHNDGTTYSCKTCEKTFKILTNLKRHLKTHTNERPHVCDQCGKSFKDKSLLIRHKKTHGKDRPYSCAHCNRVFLSKSELRRHLLVHSDEKPFACKYCQTVFRRKDNLHRHVRHHHPENPSANVSKITNNTGISTNLSKNKQINSKQKSRAKKTQKITCNVLPRNSTKVSVVCVNSQDQISSRLDSMGNITPIIRTTSEVSNAVPVINGPINIKKPDDKIDTKKKIFTYTDPIPLAEAVVINKRIEEKLYPQNASNHNYFFRNCLNCIDKSYPIVNQTLPTNSNIKDFSHKISYENTYFSEPSSNIRTNFTSHTEEKQVCNKKDTSHKTDSDNRP